jgi:hypothetical protein
MDNPNRIRPLAQDYVEVIRSDRPMTHYHGSASIAVMPDGNLIASYNHGGPDYWMQYGFQAEVCISTDGGLTWQNTLHHRLNHARAFRAGKSVYIIGQLATERIIENPNGTRRIKNGHKLGDLAIIKSDDNGVTWGEQVNLTSGERWHQAPSNVCYKDGNVYLVMEKCTHDAMNGWNVNEMAPVLMRGCEDADLTRPENWTFASAVAVRDAVDLSRMEYFGVPYYNAPINDSVEIVPGRSFSPCGLLETQVVQITDPNHVWYDPSGKTLHLIARAHVGIAGYACLLQVVERKDGTMATDFVYAPSGKKQFFIPLPGGQMKFHIVYDDRMKLYWLLSSQATDSTIRPDRMPPDRFGMPDSERQRLVLHFSRNCYDWIFAGVVAQVDHPRASRHYAAMDIQGDDLVILSRSGDENAQSAHNGNIITFHRVKDFRGLVY